MTIGPDSRASNSNFILVGVGSNYDHCRLTLPVLENTTVVLPDGTQFDMATAGPPRPPQQGGAGGGQTILGGQISAEQIEERMKAEAARLNIPLEQFKQIQRMQQARFEAEAAKAGMTPQQFMAFQQQQLQKAAAEAGMSPQEFLAMKQKEAIEQQKMAEQQQQQQQGQGQPNGDAPQQGQAEPGQPQLQRIDLTKPMEAKPEALAVAKFLRSQDLKTRTCIFDGQRKDMFKGEQVDSSSVTEY